MNVLKTIEKYGFYWYVPERWSDEVDKEIKELRQKKIIQSLAEANIRFINEDYCFILYDNPDNVRVKTRTKSSWLVSDKTKGN